MTDIQAPEATIQLKRLEYLLSKVTDRALRTELEREISKLKMNKKFGIVFEEHLPEHVRLYHLPIVVGAKVVTREGRGDDVFVVEEVKKNTASIRQEIDGRIEEVPVKDLVVIKKFGEPIYPSLIPVDKVQRDETKPWHTIINAENFHALQLLLYCYEGQVDVIYIDPPYNTGARDWKYNNNYVDSNDLYRHSKWLSMMKRRLVVAKRLLKQDGVLIITIDDNETCELGLLLDECFKEKSKSIVVIKYNPAGTFRNGFSRCHEYAYFVMNPSQEIEKKPAPLDERERNLRRNGNNSNRDDSPTMFYSILVDKKTLQVIGVGNVPDKNFHPKKQTVETTTHYEIWPIDDRNKEKNWYYSRNRVQQSGHKELFCKRKGDRVHVYFKTSNDGASKYQSVWTGSEFDAGAYGSSLVKSILGKEFPFPKSVYAVRDCLHAVVGKRKDALILDFFAGSGTTLHATAILNAQDNGKRRCILVTNNEVGEENGKILLKKGIYPGNPEYEKHGICESITWPRCKYAISGKRDDGTKLVGEYLNGEKYETGFNENAQLFRIEYLNPYDVEYREKLADILPILWLTAGGKGSYEPIAKEKAWFMPDNSTYAILLDESQFAAFKKALKERSNITHVFLVTDSEDAYRDMCGNLPPNLQFKMLYHSYLENFRINIPQEL